jgi:hypothetical protein
MGGSSNTISSRILSFITSHPFSLPGYPHKTEITYSGGLGYAFPAFEQADYVSSPSLPFSVCENR